LFEQRFVVVQPAQQEIPRGHCTELMPGGQVNAVAGHLVGIEEFGAQQPFVGERKLWMGPGPTRKPDPGDRLFGACPCARH